MKPAASLERLEEVFVLLTMKPLELKQESPAPGSATPPATAPSAAATNPALTRETMNDTYDIRGSELHIEVHKFRAGAIILATAFALVLQAFLPIYFPKASILDLPLLIVIYFGLSRRNPSTGLASGHGDRHFAGQP